MAFAYLILILAVVATVWFVVLKILRKNRKQDVVMAQKSQHGTQNHKEKQESEPEPADSDATINGVQQDKAEKHPHETSEIAQVGSTSQAEHSQTELVQPEHETASKESYLADVDVEAPPEKEAGAQAERSIVVEPKLRKVEPIKKGGRPRSVSPERETSEKKKTRTSKPEIVCWEIEGKWILAVEIPEELSGNSSIRVLQDGESLAQAESEGYWPLRQAEGDIQILWFENEIQRESTIALGRKDYLLFKLSSDQKRGRVVKFPSSGWYLVVVPHEWERDISLSGHPPVAPEPVSISGYQGHFFVLTGNKDESICFQVPGRQSAVIRPKKLQVELIGNRLDDAEDMTVPLFGTMPPRICALNNELWKDVKTIILGEEGHGRGRWRTEFQPDVEEFEQEMPAELLARRGGWYFLRFYDTNDNLIDSLDFKFLSGLKAIERQQSSALPSKDGHEIVVVNFIHDLDCVVQPLEKAAHVETIKKNDSRTLISLPASPVYDESNWLIRSINGPQIEVAIILERIWWGLGNEKLMPSEWSDKVLDLSRSDFYATSEATLWLKCLKRNWLDSVLIGFDEKRARKVSIRAKESVLAIPLREFVDSPEVEDRSSEYFLKIWMDSQSCDVALLPKSKFRCAQASCDFVAMNLEAMTEHVKVEHLQLFISPLNYFELREYNSSLPQRIYKCSYCPKYVPSDDYFHSPTNSICRHIEVDCPNVDRSSGPPRILFSVVTDAEEIRRDVFADLPHIDKCILCERRFPNPTEQVLIKHLIDQHANDLYRYE